MVSFSLGARRKLALPVAALAAATALVGAFAPAAFADDTTTAPAAVTSSAPATPVAEFNAALCSTDGVADQTNQDPKVNTGINVMPDLTRVFGQRLADYNAGNTVLLYTTAGAGAGGTPNCGVHYDSATEAPVSEWMFCTDHGAKTCSGIDKDGFLTQGGARVGQLENKDGNSRLTADQEKVISYIVRHELPVTNDGFLSLVDVASNKTPQSRDAKQNAVWCVSDPQDFADPFLAGWCEDAIGADKQAKIIASMPDSPELTLTPASTDVATGETATLALTTNLFNQPISLTPATADLSLCAPQPGVELSNGELFITSLTTPAQTVNLCVSSATPAQINVQAEVTAHSGASASWVQSPGGAGQIACQVYARTEPGAATDLQVEAVVTVVDEANTGADADANANGADANTNGADADANGADANTNGADADANANGADANTNGASADANGTAGAGGAAGSFADSNADADNSGAAGSSADADNSGAAGSSADANGADAGGAAGGASSTGANGTAGAGASASASASASATSAGTSAATSAGNGSGAKGGLANTGAASPFVAGAAALVLLAAGAGALALRRREQH